MNRDNLLSKELAIKIANSQKDLGGKSKVDMVYALSGENDEERKACYEKLDSLTKLIVDRILDSEDIDDMQNNLQYSINEITNALNSLK